MLKKIAERNGVELEDVIIVPEEASFAATLLAVVLVLVVVAFEAQYLISK